MGRASRGRGACAHRRHLRHRERRHRRRRTAEIVSTGASRTGALHHRRTAADVPRVRAGARETQERSERRHSRCRFGDPGATSADGCEADARIATRRRRQRGEPRPKSEETFMKTMNACMVVAMAVLSGACQENAPATGARVSGQADATEVQIAPEVGGRVIELTIEEGDRVKQGAVVARLDSRDADLALRRAQAERSQADAQLRLLQAGSGPRISGRPKRRWPPPPPTSRPHRPTCRPRKPIFSDSSGCSSRTRARRSNAMTQRHDGTWREIVCQPALARNRCSRGRRPAEGRLTP